MRGLKQKRKPVKRRKKELKLKKILILATLCMTFATGLTSCVTTETKSYPFPSLGEERREETAEGIKVYNIEGKCVFFYSVEGDTVTIPLWYWNKLLRYGIDTGGIDLTE